MKAKSNLLCVALSAAVFGFLLALQAPTWTILLNGVACIVNLVVVVGRNK